MANTINIPVVNILLVDDHSLVAEGLKELLKKMLPDDCTIHVFDSLEKAKHNLLHTNTRYDFIITDLVMPGQDVPGFISYLRNYHPNLIILIISSVIDTNTIKECLSLGINGYISKGTTPEEIKFAFENTYSGRKFISSDLSGRLASSVLSIENTTLTKKELEVLRLLAAGHKTNIVADMLHVSPITIMTHKRNLMQKLNLHSVVGLVKYAYDNHLT